MPRTAKPCYDHYYDDWIAGCAGMTLEEEGFYVRFVQRFYSRKGILRDDDREMAHLMALDIRTYRRVLARMIKARKIVRKDGRLYNPRAAQDREETEQRLQQNRLNGAKGGARKSEIGPTSGELRANFGRTSDESLPELSAILDPMSLILHNSGVACAQPSLDIPLPSSLTTVTTNPPAPNGASPPKGGETKKPRKKATRIPDDWQPTESDIEYAQLKGMTDDQIPHFAEEFRIHWAGECGRSAAKLNWSMAWKKRVLQLVEHGRIGKVGRQSGNSGRQSGNGQRKPNSFARAAARVLAKAEDGERVVGNGSDRAGFPGGDQGGALPLLSGPAADDS